MQAKEQDRYRNRDQNRARHKHVVVSRDVVIVYERVQADGDRPAFGLRAEEIAGENEVAPRRKEAHKRGVNDDRFTERKDNFEEDLRVGRAVDTSSFVERAADRVEEAFGDVISKTRRSGINEDQCDEFLPNFNVTRHTDGFEDVIDRSHRHEAREHTEDHTDRLKSLTTLKAETAHNVRHRDRKESGKEHTNDRDDKGIDEPSPIRIIGIGKQFAIPMQAERRREKVSVLIGAFGSRERLNDHPNKRHDPKEGQDRQNGVRRSLADQFSAFDTRGFLSRCDLAHYWKSSSFLLAELLRYVISDTIEQTTNVKIPKVEASL